MVIHSVTPLEYLLPQDKSLEMEYRPCKYGFVAGTNGIDGFTISRIITTDLNAYLDKDFSLGNIFKE